MTKPRVRKGNYYPEVDGLYMTRLQESIILRGMVRLHMTGEEDESMLADCEWPKKSGRIYLACAATGLLFDKQTGECRQSGRLSLRIDTLAAASPKEFNPFMAQRRSEGAKRVSLTIGKDQGDE